MSACSPAAPVPTPTLYLIPTALPTALPTITDVTPVMPPTDALSVSAITDVPTLPATSTIDPTTLTSIPTVTDLPTLTPTTAANLPAHVSNCTPNAEFIGDVTIPDNTVMPYSQKFVKTWKIKNTGTCDWTTGYRIVFWMGNQMSAPTVTNLPPARVGQTADVSLNMIVPTDPGVHLSIWKLVGPDGLTFGAQPYVQIIAIYATPTPTPLASATSAIPVATLTPTKPTPITSTATPTPTKAVVATLPPAPNNPVISGITARSREIYLAGKQRGNISYAFSKAGDSLTASYLFLYQIGDRAEILGSYSSLAPAIDRFRTPLPDGANSFNRTSRAATGGWDSVMLLDPARADASCNGLRPFECELVQLKPAVVLILIGTNDAQHHVDSGLYEQNLRTMVQLSINNGTIPVLYTIPWNKYRDPGSFNSVITTVARAYDIPLVNYLALMEQLPNHGVSEDEVHPSEPPDHNAANFANNLGYGTTVRNLVTVQLLDALWRQVMYD